MQSHITFVLLCVLSSSVSSNRVRVRLHNPGEDTKLTKVVQDTSSLCSDEAIGKVITGLVGQITAYYGECGLNDEQHLTYNGEVPTVTEEGKELLCKQNCQSRSEFSDDAGDYSEMLDECDNELMSTIRTHAAFDAARKECESEEEDDLHPGLWVKLIGLKNKPEFNGKIGILAAKESSGRWRVTLQEKGLARDDAIAVKPENLAREDGECCCKHGADGSVECSVLPVSEMVRSKNPLKLLRKVCPKQKGYHSWNNEKHFDFGGVLPASCEDTKCCCKHGEDGSAECSLLSVSELVKSKNPLKRLMKVCPKHKGYHSWDNEKHFALGGVLPASCQEQ